MNEKKLGEIALVIAGQSPPSKFYNKIGEGLPFFQGKTDFGKMYPIVRSWCTNPSKIAEKDDILMSVRAPVGPVNLADQTSCIGRGLAAIRAKDNYSSKYLYYFLKNNQRIISKYSTGSTFKAITQKNIKAIHIPIPKSLADQKRIAHLLSHCEDLIRKRKASIGLLDEYLKSLFLEMFGDPRVNPMEWEMASAIKYSDCIVPGRDKPKSFSGSTPWVTTNDLAHLGFTRKSKKKLGLSKNEIQHVRARIIPKNSVLMTCVGDLGTVSIASCEMVVNQQLHTFQCSPRVEPIFLMFALYFQTSYMYKMASKTTIPYLNKTNCNNIPVFYPPHDLQTKFSKIVEKVKVIFQKKVLELQELENLYGTLSQQAFRGELDLKEVPLPEKEEGSSSFKQLIEQVDNLEQIEESNSTKPPKNLSELQSYLKKQFEKAPFLMNDLIVEYQNQDVDYEKVKKKIFSWLGAKPPILEQIFDEKDNTIKLKLTDEAFKT